MPLTLPRYAQGPPCPWPDPTLDPTLPYPTLPRYAQTRPLTLPRYAQAPIASGSIAQIHRATLNGKSVAVKVRHPSVVSRIVTDFTLMRGLAELTARFPPLRWLNLKASVGQFSSTMVVSVPSPSPPPPPPPPSVPHPHPHSHPHPRPHRRRRGLTSKVSTSTVSTGTSEVPITLTLTLALVLAITLTLTLTLRRRLVGLRVSYRAAPTLTLGAGRILRAW